MTVPPEPLADAERIAILHRYNLLDSSPDVILDSITQAAAKLCETPIALITFVDEERLWIRSGVGRARSVK